MSISLRTFETTIIATGRNDRNIMNEKIISGKYSTASHGASKRAEVSKFAQVSNPKYQSYLSAEVSEGEKESTLRRCSLKNLCLPKEAQFLQCAKSDLCVPSWLPEMFWKQNVV